MVPGRRSQRKMPHRLKGCFDFRNKTVGNGFGRFLGNIRPNFSEVGCGGVRDAES
jgi:hypothetical protein